MKNVVQSRFGFTLIELLVVVLIIGILAAVALPQYQFAVAKSRLMSLMPIARNVKLAIQRYYWANNRYPTSFDELDIDLPCLEEGSNPCYLSKDVYVQLVGYYTNILDQRVKGTRFVYFYSGPGTCYAYDTPNKDFSNRLCKSISGKEPFESEGGSNRYIVWED